VIVALLKAHKPRRLSCPAGASLDRPLPVGQHSYAPEAHTDLRVLGQSQQAAPNRAIPAAPTAPQLGADPRGAFVGTSAEQQELFNEPGVLDRLVDHPLGEPLSAS
jgi:hypothetical protein